MIPENVALGALLRTVGVTGDQFAEGGPDGQPLIDLVTGPADVWKAFRADLADATSIDGLLSRWQATPATDSEDAVFEWYLQARS